MRRLLTSHIVAWLVVGVAVVGIALCAAALLAPAQAPALTGTCIILGLVALCSGLVMSRLDQSGFGDDSDGPLPGGTLDMLGWVGVAVGIGLVLATFGVYGLLLERGLEPTSILPHWM